MLVRNASIDRFLRADDAAARIAAVANRDMNTPDTDAVHAFRRARTLMRRYYRLAEYRRTCLKLMQLKRVQTFQRELEADGFVTLYCPGVTR